MKTFFKTTTTLFTLLTISMTVAAQTVTWLEGGNEVNATQSDQHARNNQTNNIVTLATGEEVLLIGGVYVKTSNSAALQDWAKNSGYAVTSQTEQSFIVSTTPEQSIAIAAEIAKLQGVETAAPQYQRKFVSKSKAPQAGPPLQKTIEKQTSEEHLGFWARFKSWIGF